MRGDGYDVRIYTRNRCAFVRVCTSRRHHDVQRESLSTQARKRLRNVLIAARWLAQTVQNIGNARHVFFSEFLTSWGTAHILNHVHRRSDGSGKSHTSRRRIACDIRTCFIVRWPRMQQDEDASYSSGSSANGPANSWMTVGGR